MKQHAEEALAAPRPPKPPNATQLSHWFPLVQAAGLPVPQTIIVPGLDDEALWGLSDGIKPPGMDAIVQAVVQAGDKLGWPCFLRTGLTSYKHDWKESCFLPSPDKALSHIINLCNFSMMADMFGLPCTEFAVREMLQSVATFSAFNGMPVAREIRCFFEGGTVSGYQGYWPADSIEDPSRPDWQESLVRLQTFRPDELAVACLLAFQAGEAAAKGGLCADWSVDFLQTRDRGWVLIDMADAGRSFRSPDFETIPAL